MTPEKKWAYKKKLPETNLHLSKINLRLFVLVIYLLVTNSIILTQCLDTFCRQSYDSSCRWTNIFNVSHLETNFINKIKNVVLTDLLSTLITNLYALQVIVPRLGECMYVWKLYPLVGQRLIFFNNITIPSQILNDFNISAPRDFFKNKQYVCTLCSYFIFLWKPCVYYLLNNYMPYDIMGSDDTF